MLRAVIQMLDLHLRKSQVRKTVCAPLQTKGPIGKQFNAAF